MAVVEKVMPELIWSWRFSPTAGREILMGMPSLERIFGLPTPESSRI